MDELMKRMLLAMAELNRSPYLPEFRQEHRVIPGMCGLPTIIRAFVRG